MPDDWIFEVEAIILKLIPAYTLETLDNSDIERILPYYFWDYRKALARNAESPELAKNIKTIGGKQYRHVSADSASWL